MSELKTDDEMMALMNAVIKSAVKILGAEQLRVPETDRIIDMVFAFFLKNSVESIPQNTRVAYIKDRLMTLSGVIRCTVEDVPGLEPFLNKDAEIVQRETMH